MRLKLANQEVGQIGQLTQKRELSLHQTILNRNTKLKRAKRKPTNKQVRINSGPQHIDKPI